MPARRGSWAPTPSTQLAARSPSERGSGKPSARTKGPNMPSRSPSIDLSGRVAVITGASSGIGAQAARALATAGATVALMARRIERLEAIVGELKASGASAAAYGVDVTDAEALRAAAATIEDELGPASIVVNNAGIMLPTAAKDLDGTDARRQIDLNVAALNAVIAAFVDQTGRLGRRPRRLRSRQHRLGRRQGRLPRLRVVRGEQGVCRPPRQQPPRRAGPQVRPRDDARTGHRRNRASGSHRQRRGASAPRGDPGPDRMAEPRGRRGGPDLRRQPSRPREPQRGRDPPDPAAQLVAKYD